MIELNRVIFRRPNLNFAFDIKIPSQQFVSVIGASGSGKSTFLELIAGFITPLEGNILIDQNDVTHLPVENRQVSYAFQQNALFPHLDVLENVSLALHDQKNLEKTQMAQDILAQMGLGKDFWGKKPGQISGGELTRANLARALLRPCKVLLLDEPFASLDEITRMKLLELTHKIHLAKKVTTIFVTHQRDDAQRFSQTVLEISKGQIVNRSQSL